jgi:glucose/arabinose dehydrogenase
MVLSPLGDVEERRQTSVLAGRVILRSSKGMWMRQMNTPQVSRLKSVGLGCVELEPFIDGFMISGEPGDHLGRPYALTLAPNGILYITDDTAGAVYQIRYTNPLT